MFSIINKEYRLIKDDLRKDNIIEPIISKINDAIFDIDFNNIKEMKERINKIQGKAGLYYFEVQQISEDYSWTEFENAWSNVSHSPLIVKKRWDKHQFTKDTYYPFYVGKAINGISDRVAQHIFATKKTVPSEYLASTKTLRLKQHYEQDAHIFECFKFRVGAIALDLDNDLLPILESTIRLRKVCIAGSDRT